MAEDLIKTGIAGLDNVLMGGIPRDNTILVQGAAGMLTQPAGFLGRLATVDMECEPRAAAASRAGSRPADHA